MTIIDEARALLKRSAANVPPEDHTVRQYEQVEDENLAIGEATLALLQKLVEPQPVAQTSASARVEHARVTINEAIAASEDEDSGIEGLITHRDNLIDALDEFISPPGIGMPELVRDFRERITEQGSLAVLGQRAVHEGGHEPAIEGYRLGLADGEQYAHERWEPADRPSQEQMLRWLGIENHEEPRIGDTTKLRIPTQYIEKEVI